MEGLMTKEGYDIIRDSNKTRLLMDEFYRGYNDCITGYLEGVNINSTPRIELITTYELKGYRYWVQRVIINNKTDIQTIKIKL